MCVALGLEPRASGRISTTEPPLQPGLEGFLVPEAYW